MIEVIKNILLFIILIVLIFLIYIRNTILEPNINYEYAELLLIEDILTVGVAVVIIATLLRKLFKRRK